MTQKSKTIPDDDGGKKRKQTSGYDYLGTTSLPARPFSHHDEDDMKHLLIALNTHLSRIGGSSDNDSLLPYLYRAL
jgi:hypothetical protein